MIQDKTIIAAIPLALQEVDIPFLGEKSQGKVRDIYIADEKRILITTDRQSAFDHVLGLIPYKGMVLNLLSEFWFNQTRDIVDSHMISVPDPNVMITKDCLAVPIEMIVRGYMTGVTATSIWYSYQRGERVIYGIEFPDGMKKNDKLPRAVITPTTHGGGPVGSYRSTRQTGLTERSDGVKHDERLTEKEILEKNIVSKELWEQMKKVSLALFERGSELCRKAGLILVDTKYEFGLHDGKLTLIDEIHTPDSSRFWIEKTYKERIGMGLEPDNFDKEFLRLWYAQRGYTGEGIPPPMTEDLIVKTAKRYISVYEKITGKVFLAIPLENRQKEIAHHVKQALT